MEKKDNRIKSFFKSRKAKKGSAAAAIIAAAAAVLILFNVAANLLVERNPGLKLDMTSSGTYQLRNDTKQYLSQLDKDITVYVLVSEDTFKSGMNAYSGSQYFIQADELLKKMAAASPHMKLEFVDLSSNPTFTSKYGDIDWSSSGANNLLIVENGDEHTALEMDECFTYDASGVYAQYGYYEYTSTTIEQAVITGMLSVVSGDRVAIDFIKGSGENESYYAALVKLLEQNAYKVNEVNLLTEKPSEDSEIVFLYAPTVDLSKDACDKLENWLENDGEYGKTLIYIPYNDDIKTPNLNNLLENYGMKLSSGFAFCANYGYMVNDQYTFITDYSDETYTDGLKNSNIPVVVGYSRAVEITDENAASAILSVSESAGIVPFAVEEDKTFEDYLTADEVNLASVGKKSGDDGAESRLAVFGSPSMFSSAYLATASFNNSNYIVNFCNIVTDRGDMGITITSASTDNTELGTITEATSAVMGAIFIAAVPIIVLLIGLIVYIRRRSR